MISLVAIVGYFPVLQRRWREAQRIGSMRPDRRIQLLLPSARRDATIARAAGGLQRSPRPPITLVPHAAVGGPDTVRHIQ
jgi:hypothetical protein